MARLNEPPVSTDTTELLRRKFLRQNRDLARINSTQSLKIRNLENECSRLLSENLELRGQILKLEKDVEDTSAQRVADHALEIKAKLEAQLIEWGALLSTLGSEPPTKRRNARDRGMVHAKSRQPQRSPSQRPSRRITQDLEALALQEGRLPPIAENKTYPRATLTAEEITALCNSEQNADSPEIGPPPVSRFVDDNIAKAITPSKKVTPEVEIVRTAGNDAASSKQNSAQTRQTPSHRAPAWTPNDFTAAKVPLCAPKTARPEALKPGSKRKFSAGYDPLNSQGRQPLQSKTVDSNTTKCVSDLQKGKSVKDREAGRKGIRDRPVQTARKVLAAKSTNQVLLSPKKDSKNLADKPADPKPETSKEGPPSELERSEAGQGHAIELLLDTPLPASVVDDVALYVNPPQVDAGPTSPDTPVRTERGGSGPSDTPPPADISLNGEVSRPSRRVRPAISYAEPNLRDKMRRPTKELFDAVSGEGKFIQRSSTAHKLDDSGLPSAIIPESEPPQQATTLAESRPGLAAVVEVSNNSLPDSVTPDVLPTSVLTTRRTRTSSMAARGSLGTTDTVKVKQEETHESGVKPKDQVHDIYEFMDSSPTLMDSDLLNSQMTTVARNKAALRRSSVVTAPVAQLADEAATDKPMKAMKEGGSRKRASMAVRSKPRMAVETHEDDAPGYLDQEAPTTTDSLTKDRISRRRSMML